MTEEEILTHSYFLKIFETNRSTAAMYSEKPEFIRNYYFRNQIDLDIWEKAQIVYPLNVHSAKKGVSFVYFTTNPDGTRNNFVNIKETPSWFQEIYFALKNRSEQEWKLKILLGS